MLHFTERDGTLLSLTVDSDTLNWVEGEFHAWGEAEAPQGIVVSAERTVTNKGRLREVYTFLNTTSKAIALHEAGIWATFNDNYDAASVCFREKCHAHIWCGGASSWVNALALRGDGPHLGLVLTEGALTAYKIQRQENSNDRGDFCLLIPDTLLQPGETYTLAWELFSHEGGFFEILSEYPSYISITAPYFTFFANEQPAVQVQGRSFPLPAEQGYHTVWLKDSCFRYSVMPDREALLQKRCQFICRNQQETEPGAWQGAYLVYDNETGQRIKNDNPNHNAGRERIGMGLLLARYLQSHSDDEMFESLMRYTDFVLREFFDAQTGEVFNGPHRSNTPRRLYNNAWYASFFRELYRLTGQKQYLFYMCGAFRDLYTHGGTHFYPLGMEATDAIQCLKKEAMTDLADELMGYFTQNAAYMEAHGTDYPSLEVKYEDNIVIPAGILMAQMFTLTGEAHYLLEAEKHMKKHESFTGFQPDARMHGASVHHWDDFWFGKRRLYGDTYPHYWITAGSLFYAQMSILENNKEYEQKARAGLRSALNCFFPDGSATCAIVTPASVNGRPGDFIDPWANDQDWALYHALIFDESFGL